MKTIPHLFLSVLLALISSSCNHDSEPQESQDSETVAVDTIHVSDLKTVVSTETALLGEPRDIVSIDERQFRV